MNMPVEAFDTMLDETEGVRQWVTFCLGGQDYGVLVEAVQEVLRVPEIAPVPGAPSCMLGVMNLRGNIVAVIDGRERFGKASAAIDEDARVLVLALDACACGMVVDCVTDVVDLKPEDLQPLTTLDAHAPDSPVAGVAYRNDGFLVLVDQDALLPEEIIGGTGDSDG